MMLHARGLNVVLKSGLQLRQLLLLGLGIKFFTLPVRSIGGLFDVLQALVGRDLLVFDGETHAGPLHFGVLYRGAHCEGM